MIRKLKYHRKLLPTDAERRRRAGRVHVPVLPGVVETFDPLGG